MDRLKTDAVLWERESGAGDVRWLAATQQDLERTKGWGRNPEPSA